MTNENTTPPDVVDEVLGGATEQDVNWDDFQVVPGLEHLGRAILDAQGQPSGSPANYENLRGQTGLPPTTPFADVVTSIAAEFPPPEATS